MGGVLHLSLGTPGTLIGFFLHPCGIVDMKRASQQASGPSWVKRTLTLMLVVMVASVGFFTYSAVSSHSYAPTPMATPTDGSAAAVTMGRESDSTPGIQWNLRKRQDASAAIKPASSVGVTAMVPKGSKGISGSGSSSGSGSGNDNADENVEFAHQQKSKYTYVTLISGIDDSFRYRGFLYNALIMRKALLDAGSTADFVAMIGFTDDDRAPFESDMQLLRDAGILIYILPRWVHEQHDLSFAEMALLKITPWSFTHYDKVQFFDGDVMPTKNMDCLFKLKYNSFTAGAVSPLNSGWYMGIPDKAAYEYMKSKAIWRLSKDWDKETGWNERMPEGLVTRGGQSASKLWDFNGSDMDQGLLLHYHAINHGQTLLIDTTTGITRVYEAPKGLSAKSAIMVKTETALECCEGVAPNPTSMFAHFTGRGKPWMLNEDNEKNSKETKKRMRNRDVKKWFQVLDSLKLDGVNSKNIGSLHLGSPLGFWNHNFPKGGFNLQEQHSHLAEK